MEGGVAVVDFEANPGLAGTRDEQPVPPCFSQIVTDVAADVGVDVAFGERRACHHHGAPRGADFGPLVGSGHEQQGRGGVRSGVHASRDGVLVGGGLLVVRGVPFHEQFGGEGLAAHVVQTPLVWDVSRLAGSCRQIDPQDTAGKAVKAPRVGHDGPLARTTKKPPQVHVVSYMVGCAVG